MDYLTTLVTTDSYAKEVKLFGLGPYFIDRFRQLATIYQDRQRRIVVTRYFAGFIWSTLTILAGSLTYLYVALQAVAGRLTLGDLTLFTQAASSVQSPSRGCSRVRLDVREPALPERPVRPAGDALRDRGGPRMPRGDVGAVGGRRIGGRAERSPREPDVRRGRVRPRLVRLSRIRPRGAPRRVAADRARRDGRRRRPERCREVDPDQAPVPALRPDGRPDPPGRNRPARARARRGPPAASAGCSRIT